MPSTLTNWNDQVRSVLDQVVRASVGFEPVFRLLDENFTPASGYPPYNIEKVGDDYRISLAVAGFSLDQIEVVAHEGSLTISGQKTNETANDDKNYLYRGIANRSFRRQFRLADNIEVTGANMEDGILTITLVRNVPEELQPKKIPINAS